MGANSKTFERGGKLLEDATALVREVLRANPDGLTNSEVGDLTGLNPAITVQQGYVTWSILRSLIESDEAVKIDALYRLKARGD